MNDEFLEGCVNHALSYSFELLYSFPEVVKHCQASVRLLNDVIRLLQSRDGWKISFRQGCDITYSSLWRVLLKQDRIVEALFAAEKGRARKAIFSSSVSENGEVYTPETSCVKRTSVYIKNTWIKQLCNHNLRDFATAFRVRKLFGTFEKRAPG